VVRLCFTGHFRSECHVASARCFSNVHLALGALAAGLAAGAGGTAFSGSSSDVAGALAIAAATITGLLTALRPDERAQQHWKAAGAYARLMEETYASSLASPDREVRSGRLGHDATGTPPRAERKRRRGLGDQIEEPSPDSSDRREPHVHPLGHLFEQYHRLEAIGPTVPRWLAHKAQKAIKKRAEWFPPQYEAFCQWQLKRLPEPTATNDVTQGILWHIAHLGRRRRTAA
jgi:hypothetical protein